MKNPFANLFKKKTDGAPDITPQPSSTDKKESFLNLISYVKDRPAHDKHYAVNIQKIKRHISWKPTAKFNKFLNDTIEWYLDNSNWWKQTLKKNYKLKRLGLKHD